MRTTNMPGFTAERSLYASTVSNRWVIASQRRDSEAVIPAQGDCLPIKQICSACIPSGPTVWSGRQFCQTFTCQPTFGGGCRCRLFSKGFVSCRPFDFGGVATF
jgi:hypothetical protein